MTETGFVPATVTRRWPQRVWAVAAAVVGVVAVSIGAAIAVPFIRVTGWSLRSVIGAIVLAGGAALLAIGVVVGLRTVRRRWWALVIPVGLVITYAITVPTVVSVAAVNVPRAPLESVDTSSLGVVDEVSFAASDGVRLAAWWVEPTDGAAIVVLPGASSTRTAVVDQAAVLVRNGYGVLLVDPRGMGASGGRAMNLGWYGERDVVAAVDWLVDVAGIEPTRIGALGESMGGEQALGALAVDERLGAVVAEGATRTSGQRHGVAPRRVRLAWLVPARGRPCRYCADCRAQPPPRRRARCTRRSPRPNGRCC